MPRPNVILRGVSDIAISTVGALAGLATSTAGAVSGAAVGGGVGALHGATQGIAHGTLRGRRSSAATIVTVAAVGAAGLIEWPVLLAATGTALTLDKLINRGPSTDPRFQAVDPEQAPVTAPRTPRTTPRQQTTPRPAATPTTKRRKTTP